MMILYVIHLEPMSTGAGPYRLPYDILSACSAIENVKFCVFGVDELKEKNDFSCNFIPWSKIAIHDKRKHSIVPQSVNLRKKYEEYTINLAGYDKVIFSCYNLTLLNLANSNAEIYTFGMDSAPMLYLRGFCSHHKIIYKLFCLYEFFSALDIDSHAVSVSKMIFTVGQDDASFYHAVFKTPATFIYHPYNTLIDGIKPLAWHAGEKLRLCIPGGISYFYTADLLDEIFDLILKNEDFYSDKISVSFLGAVRYKSIKKRLLALENSKIQYEYTRFAPSFEEYIASHHLILLPVTVGAGTKNRCASSAGIGLDFIATPVACENVHAADSKEHIARNAREFIDQINLRLSTQKLYPLSDAQIKDFKNTHSTNQWKEKFWNKIIFD